MTLDLGAYVVHARGTPAADRERLRAGLAERPVAGGFVLATCQRVAVYGPRPAIRSAAADLAIPGARRLADEEAARHLLAVATGLDSTVVGEDQVLHQVRMAARAARAAGPLHPTVDRLVDLALRTGRRARSWLPSVRPSLADVALDRVGLAVPSGVSHRDDPRPVLVVGAGPMGRLLAEAVRARGGVVMVASRDPARARSLAHRVGGTSTALDPGATVLGALRGVAVALAGAWRPSAASVDALVAAAPWVVDLSVPPAVEPAVWPRLGDRLLTIDSLTADGMVGSPALIRRLEVATDAALAELLAWADGADGREVARRLADRAAHARDTELAALWGQLPALDPAHRAAIARMTERLSDRLLAAPLEGLDGARGSDRPEAVRVAFRL